MPSDLFDESCAHVNYLFSAVCGTASARNAGLARSHAAAVTRAEHPRDWRDFLVVDAASGIPYHRLRVAGREVLLSVGLHDDGSAHDETDDGSLSADRSDEEAGRRTRDGDGGPPDRGIQSDEELSDDDDNADDGDGQGPSAEESESTARGAAQQHEVTVLQHITDRAATDAVARALANHPVITTLYGHRPLHSHHWPSRGPVMIHIAVPGRLGNGAMPASTSIRPSGTGLRAAEEHEWIAFNILAAAELRLSADTVASVESEEEFVRDGEDDLCREQTAFDPIAFVRALARGARAAPRAPRSIAALVVAALRFRAAQRGWPVGVKGFREDVALRDRAAVARLIDGIELLGKTVRMTASDAVAWSGAGVAVTLAAVTATVPCLSRSTPAILFAVTTLLSCIATVFVLGIRVEMHRGSRPLIFRRKDGNSVEDVSLFYGRGTAMAWTSILAATLADLPSHESHWIPLLWTFQSRLADWLDAGAKTALTREGELALALRADKLLILREDGVLELRKVQWDDWYERTFSYRTLIGKGKVFFSASLLTFDEEGEHGCDDDISHEPFSLLHLREWLELCILQAWKRTRVHALLFREEKGLHFGLPVHTLSLDATNREAGYIACILRRGLIPVASLTRMDMRLSETTEVIMSPPFCIESLDRDEVYDQLFEFEKVKSAVDLAPGIGEPAAVLSIAISYRHHIGDRYPNRMPRFVWQSELEHIRQVVDFLGHTHVRFWTDTRLSALRDRYDASWDIVGLTPYGQMTVYIVNSPSSETLVDRFWLSAERRLGMAVGGAFYTSDDGKVVLATASSDMLFDADVLTGLFGLLAASSVLGELYRDDKLKMVRSSVKNLRDSLGERWMEVVLQLPWGMTLFDISHDATVRDLDGRAVRLPDNWNAAVDVLTSRRVLSEIGEDVNFPQYELGVEVFENTDESDGESFVVLVTRSEDEMAALDVRASREGDQLEVYAIGKARLIGPEYRENMDEAGLRRTDLQLNCRRGSGD